ncbi:MAG TPA: IS21 family transposase [Mycobacteriales bacterium]|nr:IS21 family transposase [Mycobacteriales bacterium]
MIDVVEILQHWHAGRPKSVVADSLRVDVKTVRKYVAPAEAAGMAPGGPRLARAQWEELVRRWFPELVDARARSSTFPLIEPFRSQIKEMLATNTVSTVHQRLRDECGLAVGVSSFRRYCWSQFPETAEDRATVPRPPVAPGAEAQVDYGLLGSWLDPLAARARRVWAFVMVLACSRHLFVYPVLRLDVRSWVAAHVAAFAFFGGCPGRLVPDNLKTGVDRPDLYDPKLNRTYAELAEHYGVLIDPARCAKPRDKPRVERVMPYVRDSFWRGRTWSDEAAMQAAAREWCLRVAGARAHRGLDGAAPLAVFEALERTALAPLPAAPFELATWSTPKVGPDCHVKVGGALYSVPWRLIGRRVDARATDATVEVFVDGALVKTWARLQRGRRTDPGDYPPEKVAFFQRTPAWCRHRADELGPAVAELVAALLAEPVLHRLRAAQGVLRLAERYPPARLDAACRRALDVGDPGYRTVKGILAAGTEALPGPGGTSGATAPAHLHGPAALFAGLGEAGRDGHDGQDGQVAG